MDRKDISLNLKGSELTITGERSMSAKSEEDVFRRVERNTGTASRTLSLKNDAVDEIQLKISDIQLDDIQEWIELCYKLLQVDARINNSINLFRHCLSEEDLALPLLERDEVIEEISSLWRERKQVYELPVDDRTKYKVPVCVGLPGVGKTCMLEQYSSILERLGISSALTIGILILYFNGHSIQPADNILPIGCCLAWRMLYRFLVESRSDNNCPNFPTFMDALLQSSESSGLTFTLAFRIIRSLLVAAGTIGTDEVLSVFVGIDEFQAIPADMNDVMTIIFETSQELAKHHKIHVYPMLAGTEWTKIDGPGSSKALSERICIPFMSYKGSLQLMKSIFPNGFWSLDCRNSITAISEIPRATIDFAKRTKNYYDMHAKVSIERIRGLKQQVLSLHVSQWQSQPRKSVIKLVAYSIACVTVNSSDCPDITFVSPKSLERVYDLNWQQLADRGLLHLRPGENSCLTVDVPMSAVICASSAEINDRDERFEKQFIRCLKRIVELIDSPLEPWQKWENFGAYLHAAKINAWQIIGNQSVSAFSLFRGMQCTFSEHLSITLKPAIVFESAMPLSAAMVLTEVGEKNNESLHVVDVLSHEHYSICLNATNGEGVDIFYNLYGFFDDSPQRQLSILIMDQRKREGKDLTTSYMKQLTDKMMVHKPTTFNGHNALVISMVFSCLAKFGPRSELVNNTGVYSRSCHMAYSGCLRNHPSASVLIDPNKTSKTLLKSLIGCSREVASKVFDNAKQTPFRRASDLREFLRTENIKVTTVSLKLFLFEDEADMELDEGEEEEDGDSDSESG